MSLNLPHVSLGWSCPLKGRCFFRVPACIDLTWTELVMTAKSGLKTSTFFRFKKVEASPHLIDHAFVSGFSCNCLYEESVSFCLNICCLVAKAKNKTEESHNFWRTVSFLLITDLPLRPKSKRMLKQKSLFLEKWQRWWRCQLGRKWFTLRGNALFICILLQRITISRLQ